MNCMSDIDITDYMSLILDYIMKIRCFKIISRNLF